MECFYFQTHITIQSSKHVPPPPGYQQNTYTQTNTWGSTFNVSLSMHAKDAKAAAVNVTPPEEDVEGCGETVTTEKDGNPLLGCFPRGGMLPWWVTAGDSPSRCWFQVGVRRNVLDVAPLPVSVTPKTGLCLPFMLASRSPSTPRAQTRKYKP